MARCLPVADRRIRLAYGPTREAAVEDAADFCNGSPEAMVAGGLEAYPTTPALTAALLDSRAPWYVVVDGVADYGMPDEVRSLLCSPAQAVEE